MTETAVGLIGAGYIAPWHADALADTPGVRLAAVCDRDLGAAQALAAARGVPAFGDVEALIAAGVCDAVHVLTPPDSHRALAERCLAAGLDVLVEKPAAPSADDLHAMIAVARSAGRSLWVGHNFLGLPSHARLRTRLARGDYGVPSALDIVWAMPFPPLRSGPFGIWPLRAVRNLLVEIGPHPVAFAVDLLGPLQILAAQPSHPVALPGGQMRPQGFRILARAGTVDVTLTLSLVEVMEDRSLTLRGSSARVRLDYGQDVLTEERDGVSDIVLNPLRRQLALARQHRRAGWANALVQARSLNRRQPYGQSFRGMLADIYGGRGERYSAAVALEVLRALDAAAEALPADTIAQPAPPVRTRTPRPDALVIGGTGFIGRALVRALVAEGRDVRVLTRGGGAGPFADLPDQVETVAAAPGDRAALAAAMTDIDIVYNLARSVDSDWDAALANDVGAAVAVAEAALEAGVRRLVYTGTIASYDMSDPRVTITEATPFPADMSVRNLYARSKAECERRLTEMQRQRGLPLLIARPGIVVGAGGPLQHWGIGRWHGPGAVRLWGTGTNILPFVLIDDTARALVAMAEAGEPGDSVNLVGEPLLSARGYFDAIHRRLGARIDVRPGNLYAYHAADAVKYLLKRRLLGRTGLVRPSLADWKSRAHLSRFDNARAKALLGWRPEADRAAFEQRAIGAADLFGLQTGRGASNS